MGSTAVGRRPWFHDSMIGNAAGGRDRGGSDKAGAATFLATFFATKAGAATQRTAEKAGEEETFGKFKPPSASNRKGDSLTRPDP